MFAGPPLLLLGLLVVEGRSAAPLASRARELLDAYGPALAPVTLATIGIVLLAIAASRG